MWTNMKKKNPQKLQLDNEGYRCHSFKETLW